MKTLLAAVVLLAALLSGCFGAVQIVPPAEAPPPPPGKGWHCFDYSMAGRYGSSTTSSCSRTEADCRASADATRSEPAATVGFCQPSATAWCSAVFTNTRDAAWSCVRSQADQGIVGGMAGMPGTKQSEYVEMP